MNDIKDIMNVEKGQYCERQNRLAALLISQTDYLLSFQQKRGLLFSRSIIMQVFNDLMRLSVVCFNFWWN